MTGNFSRATSWIVNRRWLTVLVLLIASGISIGGYMAPDDLVQWFKSLVERVEAKPEEAATQPVWEEDDYDPPPVVQPIQLSGFDAMMVVETDSLFTSKG